MAKKKKAPKFNSSRLPTFKDEAHRSEFIDKAWSLLKKKYGTPQPPLHFSQPHELAIAVILSAQCTDDRVNIVTKELFSQLPRLKDYYEIPIARLEKLIFSTGFYKNKAKNIQAFARKLDQEYNGELPDTIEELVQFAGIGRKTANVVQQVLFQKSDGIVVDTHVARLARRFGLTKAAKENALKIEKDLMATLAKPYWYDWSLYMIFLGREYCQSRKPDCTSCFLNKICLSSTVRLDQ